LLLPEYALTVIVKGTQGRYEPVILRPSHFLINNFPVVIKHPYTQNFTPFYASKYQDGYLRDGSPSGPPLPPFSPRGDRDIPLNPILVNFAAILRLRRIVRRSPAWESKTLAGHLANTLQGVVALHAAVLWDHNLSHEGEFFVEVPGPQSPLSYNLRKWPYNRTPTPTAWPRLSTLEAIPETDTGAPRAAYDRYLKSAEAGSFPPRL
jgi:hypothetical protein